LRATTMPRANAMSQLTFEVPISEDSETAFLTRALNHVRVLHVLQFRSEGFLLVCRASRMESELFRASLPRDASHRIGVTVLNRERSGSATLLVSGRWLVGEGRGKTDSRQAEEFEFFKAMEKAPIFSLGSPTFEGGKLRVSVIAKEKVIRKLLAGLDRIRVPYTVLGLGRPRGRGDSVLNSLTAKQSGILRLAHTLGYYDVPRSTSTEELARLLRLDKGTVGEHLRRAEKHVFDGLLS